MALLQMTANTTKHLIKSLTVNNDLLLQVKQHCCCMRGIYLLLVAILLLNLLNLLGGGPLARRVHHARHYRARHWAIAVSWGGHGWSLRGHTAGWRHAWSLHREYKKKDFSSIKFHRREKKKKIFWVLFFYFTSHFTALKSGVYRY